MPLEIASYLGSIVLLGHRVKVVNVVGLWLGAIALMIWALA